MEIHLKKTLKLISKEYEIPYEELKGTARKYLKTAKTYDESLYQRIEELIELNDISDVAELNEYDIDVIKMFCKLKEIDFSGTEKEIRKRVAQFFEDLFEDLEELDSESEESEESESEESESEESVDSDEESSAGVSEVRQKKQELKKESKESVESSVEVKSKKK